MTDENDKLSFLDEKPLDQNQTAEAVQTAPPEAEVEAQAPPIEEKPVTPPQREDHNPLLPKYLDTYNELRATKQELEALRKAQTEKAAMPDPVLDPEGFAAQQERAMAERIWDVTARTSEIAARRYYGEDVVKAAFEALQAQNDPLHGKHIRRSADPWDEIVRWHHQQQLLAEFGNDPDAYKKRVIADWQAQQQQEAAQAGQAPPVPTPQAKAPIPPASLTRAPASQAKASDIPVAPGNAFDGTFAAR
jgi:hypothetical protein